MEWVVGALGALLAGIGVNAIYDIVKHGSARVPQILRRSALTREARDHDVETDGLVTLVTWSKSRKLTPDRIETTYEGWSPRAHLFDEDVWHEQVESHRARGDAGSTAYLTALAVDHYESHAGQQFGIRVAESDYAETLATAQIYATDPELKERLDTALAGPLDGFLDSVPPTSLTACVSVLSREGTVLLMRRSRTVRVFPAEWTVGINETMKYSAEPGAAESLHAVAMRGLQEELSLTAADLKSPEPLITWLGWSRQSSSFATVNLVRSHLTEAEISERRGESHSVYEHDKMAWCPLRPRAISSIITGGKTPDGSHSWNYLAPLIALELWRSRTSL
ncbi:hypothetical protein E1263_26605 [Kribbella antibiotica]|uniref:Nudix hydrolase domain-containing protein n=1 Tax=Kribbella antibiotica TaxID=190195 RepID=A0A4R4Z9T5_9ACTN|nr:hypothetical protein [Kribbella antibiotica]TDD55068.1 hypothetical protein E1263_26605 [Kribbella antibiotica]